MSSLYLELLTVEMLFLTQGLRSILVYFFIAVSRSHILWEPGVELGNCRKNVEEGKIVKEVKRSDGL